MISKRIGVATAFIVLGLAHTAQGQTIALRAGSAKIEITPPQASLGPTDILRDPLFVRAIVIGNGKSCAVLVGADVGGLRDTAVRGAIDQAAKITGCSPDNFVVSATHTHGGGAGPIRSSIPDGGTVADAIVKAVSAAHAAMRPARIGYGTTHLNLNINRDLYAEGRWTQGPNPAGISDKTLSVIELLDDRDLPIGVYLNYAMHPINFNMSGVVSGDFAGEASRYIERRYGPSTVAIFAQGASGDQNPLLTRAQNKLSRVRSDVPDASDMRLTAPAPWQTQAASGDAMRQRFAAMERPVPTDRIDAYRAAAAEVGEVVTATGVLLGESAINVMRYQIASRSSEGPIAGEHRIIQCPGRDRQDRDNPVREGALPPYADGAPVAIRVGMLRIGDIFISTVDGEVYNEIGVRLKREASVSKLMMTTLANGSANSGYIYSDRASPYLTFQVIGSRLKPGCAEASIVNAGLAMIDALSK